MTPGNPNEDPVQTDQHPGTYPAGAALLHSFALQLASCLDEGKAMSWLKIIAQLFVWVIALLILAAFISTFNIALTKQPEHKECPAVTLRDQYGNIHVIEPRI